jgi:hypothetical protein
VAVAAAAKALAPKLGGHALRGAVTTATYVDPTIHENTWEEQLHQFSNSSTVTYAAPITGTATFNAATLLAGNGRRK